jgi:hypothetical protein
VPISREEWWQIGGCAQARSAAHEWSLAFLASRSPSIVGLTRRSTGRADSCLLLGEHQHGAPVTLHVRRNVTARWRRALWITGGILGASAGFVGGTLFGTHVEQQRFEVSKLVSVAIADDYLANGQPDKALPALHFAKAYESLRGDTDGLLAKAYLATGEPCLALAFAESHLRYMERNKLTPLSMYGKSKELREAASTKCNEARGENSFSSPDGKR